MFSLLFSLLRFSCLTLFILIAGNSFEFDGKTISEQVHVHTAMIQNTKIYHSVKGWVVDSLNDLSGRVKSAAKEDVSNSEKHKLKALLKSLNSAHAKSE